jgi:hypothetical protein
MFGLTIAGMFFFGIAGVLSIAALILMVKVILQ